MHSDLVMVEEITRVDNSFNAVCFGMQIGERADIVRDHVKNRGKNVCLRVRSVIVFSSQFSYERVRKGN